MATPEAPGGQQYWGNNMGDHFYIRPGKVYAEQGVYSGRYVEINQGKIVALSTASEKELPVYEARDFNLIPGLIDLHIHGREGCDIMDGSHHSINTISRSLAKYGVTGFLGTTVTSDWPQTLKAFQVLGQAYRKNLPGARLLGAYNEGLFFTREHKGAHNEDYFIELNQQNLDAIIDAAQGALKIVALAPERENSTAMIDYLARRGIKVMLGHTDANWQQTSAALSAGACGGVHVFNGMRGIHHRDPGCAGAVLLNRQAMVEVIADGVHLHPAILDMVHRLKGRENMLLISDCINAGGLQDGQYRLGMMDVNVEQGIARTVSGSLAGSTLTLNKAIANMHMLTDIRLLDIIHMASLIPATFIGRQHDLGSIASGKSADLVLVDDDFNVQSTWIAGQQVYCRPPPAA